ncbi:MAG: host-nuclease inhibitor Gam family protein [Burkholderiaceae bacterium]
MSAHRIPRTTEQATAMLERFAVLADEIGAVEADRNAAIADANAIADKALEPLLAEQGVLLTKLEPWWAKASAELTKGKRKSIELGGCMIGSRLGRDTLGTADELEPVIAWLQKREWAAPLLRVTTTIDRAAVLKSIDGCYKRQLANMGFSRIAGAETFYVVRAEQQGTRA